MPKRFEKGNKYGNRFSSTNQPKKNGRKPKLYKQLKEMVGKQVGYELEKEDFENIIRCIIETDLETLEKLVKVKDKTGKDVLNPKAPIWLVNIITAMNTDVRYGRTDTLEMVFDRVFGKAVQTVQGEINTSERSKLEEMTDEELEAELAQIEEKLK